MSKGKGTLKQYLATLAVILLFAAGLFLSLWDFHFRARLATRTSAYASLMQSAELCAETFRSRLHEKTRMLEVMAGYLSSCDELMGPEAFGLLRSALREDAFQSIGVALPDGEIHMAGGQIYKAGNRAYFREAMQGKTAISDLLVSRIDGRHDFFMAAPIRREGRVVGALVGSLVHELMYDQAAIFSPRGGGFIYIVNKNGGAVLKPQENPLGIENNVFELPRKTHGACPLRSLQEGMGEDRSGTLFYTCSEAGFYMSYVPVGLNGWYALSMVPAPQIDAHLSHMRELAFILTMKVAALFCGLFAYVFHIRRRSARELAKKHRELRALTDNVMGGVLKSRTDADFTLDYVSSGYLDIMGYTREGFAAAFGDRFSATILEEDRAQAMRDIREQMECGPTIQLRYRSRTAAGETVWFYYKAHLVRDHEGLWCYAIAFDATRYQHLAERERLANERYRFIMEQHAMVVFDWNIPEDRLQASAGWLPLLGPEASLFRGDETFFARVGVHPDDLPALEAFFRGLAAGGAQDVREARLSFKKGRYVWYRFEASTLFDASGRPLRVMGLIADISMQKKVELALRDKASRDSATGLYNKAALRRRAELCLAGEAGRACALFVFDLDNFKAVNDTQGHAAGDMVIARVAELLRRYFRQTDLIGRVGGDEFAVCVPDLTERGLLADKASALLEGVRTAFAGYPVEVSASIGIACAPQDDVSFEGLFRKADAALYHAKGLGKNRFSFYEEMGGPGFDKAPSLP